MKPYVIAPLIMLTSGLWAQDRIYSVEGGSSGSAFGTVLAKAPDLDGDGVRDLVVAAPKENRFQGAVMALSGASGRCVWTASGQAAGDSFGEALSFVGDVDRDGVSDLVVGAPGYDLGSAMDCGAWYVIRGTDGTILFRKEGSEFAGRMGVSICNAGDVSGNGTPHVVVSWGGPGFGWPGPKNVDVYRCSDGVLHQRVQGTQDGYGRHLTDLASLYGTPMFFATWTYSPGAWGNAVRGSGASYQGVDGAHVEPLDADIDGDGYLDLLCSVPELPGPVGAWIGLLRFRPAPVAPPQGSINTVRTLSLPINTAQSGVGACMAPAGDVDLDGRVDFLVGCSQSTIGGRRAGHIDCYSGRTQQLIFRLLGRPYEELGTACAQIGDVNGDGVPDFVVGAPGASGQRRLSGKIDVVSGRTLRLRANETEVSVSQGGSQHLTLDVGSAWAGSTYLLLGTVTGNHPGVTLQGVNVPLNFDPYTYFTSTAANGPVLQNTLGTLDSLGRAQCTIQVPASLAPSGLTVQHACVWFDSGLNVRGATGTVPLRLNP